jgi:DHA2 family multidrug resistance protein
MQGHPPATVPGTAGTATASAGLLLYLLIGALTFSDFLQSGIVTFQAATVMGSIGASPEEYSMVATGYAALAVTAIALQRWYVERLGWRLFMQCCAALYGIGALVCAHSGDLAGFAGGRLLMAAGSSAFFNASRVLVNHIPPSPRRFVGIKFLASGLAWGVAAGPAMAALAIASGDWRWAFLGLVLPAMLIGILATIVLPGRAAATALPAQPQPLGLIVLMFGSFLLLHALQRSGFDFFGDASMLCAGGALAALALAAFMVLGFRGPKPLIGFGRFALKRYYIGLAIFTLAYLLLGGNNYMMSVLLQRGLSVPQESAGLFLAAGALGGVLTFIVLARLLPRWKGPGRYYFAGFSALWLLGWLLSRLSESAHPLHDVVPALMFNNVFVILVLATTAMHTFGEVQDDEAVFSHANQVKNMLSQFATAGGVAIATLVMQCRSSHHYDHLASSLAADNPALQPTIQSLVQFFSTSRGPEGALQLALAQLGQQVAQEATLMATLDYFAGISVFALMALAMLLLGRAWRLAHAGSSAGPARGA